MTTSWHEVCASLADRPVVVTGVSGGIGRAVLRSFSRARIIAIDRSVDLAESALADVGRAGDDRTTAVGLDFSAPSEVSRALAPLRKAAKDVGVLVNVAGVAEDAPTQLLSMESLQRQMAINFFAQIAVIQFVSRLMARHGSGSIVNVASITGLDGNRGQLAYGASKAALINATRTLSLELAPTGIRVNAVAPGVIDTAMTAGLDGDVREALMSRSASGRMGSPEEVASVIKWLASPAASYVTGQTLRIDGCI